MPLSRSHIRATVAAYLDRHAGEREALSELLRVLDGVAEPADRATLPGHVTCSAVVVDRDRRVLHVGHRATGLLLAPGGHVEAGDRTLFAAAVREVCEEAGIRPGDLCLTPQFLGAPIDIDVHDIDAAPLKGEPAHRHFDFRFVFCLTAEQPPPLALQDEEVTGAQWLPFAEVRSPTLRSKLLAAEAQGFDARPEPVNASALIHDGHGRYLLHLRDDQEGIWEPWVFALLGGGREPGDSCIEATLRRELAEEVPGLEVRDLRPFAVEEATGVDGLSVPIQVYSGVWRGAAEAVELHEGVLLKWCSVGMLDRLRLSPGLGELIRRHAAGHAAAEGARPLPGDPSTDLARSGPGWLPPELYAETVLKATASACVYFTDEEDRPLQVHSVYSPAHPWQLVGGTMDPGERPWETAVRECREETGLTVSGPPRLLAVVYGLPGSRWRYSTIGTVFDGGRLTAAQIRGITLGPHEHDDVRVLPLADWEALMPARDFARLSALDQARRTGEAAYVGDWDWGTA
ncbi:NUDIX hydrolase [Streptomyces sp. NBC_00708]